MSTKIGRLSDRALGLSIVKQLVKAHGGTVHAENAGIGKGATLTVGRPIPVFLNPPKERDSIETGQAEAGFKIVVLTN